LLSNEVGYYRDEMKQDCCITQFKSYPTKNLIYWFY